MAFAHNRQNHRNAHRAGELAKIGARQIEFQVIRITEADMNRMTAIQEEQLAWRLQCFLPLPAHGRPELLKFLRGRGVMFRDSPRLMVTGVFHAGDGKGLMGQFAVEGTAESPRLFVAPIEYLAFERGHPIINDLAVYRKAREKRGPASLSQDNDRRS
ncbi:MAG TPA: hypothetical protein VIF88_16520 [Methylocystis sp.]|jgi:hypothetical protein